MELSDFTSSQRYYLNLLVKFSGRANRLKLMQPSDMGKKKEILINENLSYLDINDQVLFNDCKENINEAIAYSKGVFLLTSIGGCIFYIKRTPITKSLWPGVVKSFAFGGIATFIYYQYHYLEYQRILQKLYVRMLNNKRNFFQKKTPIRDNEDNSQNINRENKINP